MDKLFGTDGIRGQAGEFPLDNKTVRRIGVSLARQFISKLRRPPRFITGRDTRESGALIENAFHAGAMSEGAFCESAGVMTTPGIAYLTRAFDFDAGVVISASHNPYRDNGIKIFSPSGRKIDDATERRIETDVYTAVTINVNSAGLTPVNERLDEFRASYLDHLLREANGFKFKKKIVVDCSNGAASSLAPELLASIGAEIVAINNVPDGRNINENCGSLHLDGLRSKVRNEKADLGVAFDGDADRALFIDENGEIVDGDATLWIMGRYLRSHERLANSTVVATVMSNIGLELALQSIDLKLIRTAVGDKYVLDELLKTHSEIGGEQSGHIIFPEISLVGDGMMTALLLFRAIHEMAVPLSEATEGFTRYPQILLNVEVREKRPFSEVPAIADAAAKVESDLEGQGRLLLRYSGTENLARVMIEGKDQKSIESQAKRLAAVIADALA
jgi:phosphoglucosamine mutase